MKPWSHAKPHEEIKVGWRYLVRKTFIDPTGQEQEYVTLARLGTQCVATIALTPDGQVVIAEQFRVGPEKIMQEIPGGLVDDGESIEGAARRELHEETGYTAEKMIYLGEVFKDAYSNATWHFFLAEGCTADARQHTDAGEYIGIKLITIDQLFDNARNGRMTDIEAVFLAYEQLNSVNGGISHEATN